MPVNKLVNTLIMGYVILLVLTLKSVALLLVQDLRNNYRVLVTINIRCCLESMLRLLNFSGCKDSRVRVNCLGTKYTSLNTLLNLVTLFRGQIHPRPPPIFRSFSLSHLRYRGLVGPDDGSALKYYYTFWKHIYLEIS